MTREVSFSLLYLYASKYSFRKLASREVVSLKDQKPLNAGHC